MKRGPSSSEEALLRIIGPNFRAVLRLRGGVVAEAARSGLTRFQVWGRTMGRLSVVFATLIFTVSAYAQPLDLQATCAAQARKAFNEFEREWKNDPANKAFKTLSTDYQSHYNTKLKKCLMLITMMGNQSQTSIYLSDAYERRIYAEYLWREVPSITCELVPSLRQKKYCTSREEFNAFVADYMEE